MAGSEWSIYFHTDEKGTERVEYCYGRFGAADLIEPFARDKADAERRQKAKEVVREKIATALGVEPSRIGFSRNYEVFLKVDTLPDYDERHRLADLVWEVYNVNYACRITRE